MIFQPIRSIRLVLLFIMIALSCSTNQTAEQYFQNGLQLLQNGKMDAGYKQIKKALKKSPKNIHYLSAAAASAPNQNEAYIHTKALWDNNYRNRQMLFQLTSLAFHTSIEQKLQYALERFRELPDSLRTEEFRGELFFGFHKFDSSRTIWQSLEKTAPSPELCNKIALCFQYEGEPDSMLNYLKNCRIKNLLNSTGYTMLTALYAVNYGFDQVDKIYNEAKRKGFCDQTTTYQYAAIQVFNGQLQTAKKILLEVYRNYSDTTSGGYSVSLLLGFLYLMQNDTNGLSDLLLSKKIASSGGKQVREFLKILRIITTDTVAIIPRLEEIHKVLPDPVVELVYARELSRVRRFNEADSIYRKIPMAILFSPSITIEYASLNVLLGKDSDAFQMVNRMHERQTYSKKSLELFRDIAFKMKLYDKSVMAQRRLEILFPGDVSVKRDGAFLALGMGRTDSAIIILETLIKKYPDEEQFRVMKLTAVFTKGSYREVISECERGKVSKPACFILKARAFRKLGIKNAAISAYENAISQSGPEKSDLYFELGEYLIECGESGKAVSVYSELLLVYDKRENRDTLILATILNNYAWAANQCDSVNREIIEVSKRACDLIPQKPQLIDTYASVLLKAGKYSECIALLKSKPVVCGEPQLLYYLGQAYEKRGDLNRAQRTYKDIIEMPDSTGVLRLQVNKNILNEHLKSLRKL